MPKNILKTIKGSNMYMASKTQFGITAADTMTKKLAEQLGVSKNANKKKS